MGYHNCSLDNDFNISIVWIHFIGKNFVNYQILHQEGGCIEKERVRGQSECERGGRRGDRNWSSLVPHRKGRKDRKEFYCHGFAYFAVQYFI